MIAEAAADLAQDFPFSGRLVYVRYKDHVFFKNVLAPESLPFIRETVGWLVRQDAELILLEYDRAVKVKAESREVGPVNGLLLLRSCVLEVTPLPLQTNSKRCLNLRTNKVACEYALQPKKRKTQETKETTNRRKEACKR